MKLQTVFYFFSKFCVSKSGVQLIYGRLQYLVYCLIGNLKFTYYIILPQNTRTLIIKSAFPAGMSHAGIADIIVKSLPEGGGGAIMLRKS